MPEGKPEFRRRVFYIPGFDPIHPRRYRELYRSEGAAQAALSGYQLALSPRVAGGPYGWQVATQIDGATAHAEIEVLVWSDLVKASMSAGIPATYAQLVRTAWIYIGSGALFRLMRLRKGPMIAALYPVIVLLVQLQVNDNRSARYPCRPRARSGLPPSRPDRSYRGVCAKPSRM